MTRQTLRCLILVLVVMFTNGLTQVVAADAKRVVLLTTSSGNAYTGVWNATFLKAAAGSNMMVTVLASPFDAALQSQQIDDSIARKVDALIVTPINEQAIRPALIRAKAAGVPVLLVVDQEDSGLAGLFVSFVGVDQKELGRLAGEAMIKALATIGKSTAQVAAVTGTSSQGNTILRMEGFKAALAKAPGIKLVAQEDAKWNTALSEKATGDLLVRFAARGGLDGVFGMADNQAGAAIQAIQSAGLPLGIADKGIIVVSSNCMKDGIVHIKDGSQYATNTQIPTEEARLAFAKLVEFFDGKTLNRDELVPIHSITKDNVAEFAAGCSY